MRQRAKTYDERSGSRRHALVRQEAHLVLVDAVPPDAAGLRLVDVAQLEPHARPVGGSSPWGVWRGPVLVPAITLSSTTRSPSTVTETTSIRTSGKAVANA